jgi:hypothetical protein
MLKKDQIEEIRSVLLEFENAKKYLKRQIDYQKQLLDDAALKYINRESRDDDINSIKGLHLNIKECKVREQELMVTFSYKF